MPNVNVTPSSEYLLPLLGRMLGFGAIWCLLAGLDAGSWWIGLPTVLAAALVDLALSPARRQPWRVGAAIRFVFPFLWHSVLGGVDVARRTLRPRVGLSPGLHRFRTSLPAGSPRFILIGAINLVPGMLVAELSGDVLTIHTLVARGSLESELCRLESSIAAIFGLDREPGPEAAA